MGSPAQAVRLIYQADIPQKRNASPTVAISTIRMQPRSWLVPLSFFCSLIQPFYHKTKNLTSVRFCGRITTEEVDNVALAIHSLDVCRT